MQTRKIVYLVLCVLIALFSYWLYGKFGVVTILDKDVQVAPTRSVVPCAHITSIQKNNLTPLVNSLECIFSEYSALRYERMDKTGKLLKLDHEIRHLVSISQLLEPADLWQAIWDDKYYQLGLYREDRLKYTGQLKDESEGRPYRIAPRDSYTGLEVRLVDDIDKLYDRYESKFKNIATKYYALSKSRESAEQIFLLDDEIRQLVKEMNESKLEIVIDDETIGLYGVNGQQYSGLLRKKADEFLLPYVPINQRTGKLNLVKGDKFTKLKDTLELIFNEYSALSGKPDEAEKLFLLDREISKTVKEIVAYYPFSLSYAFWDIKYLQIGLYIGHFSEQLDYSEKLLAVAHKVNPNSLYRKFTLFSAIFPEDFGSDVNNEMPDVEQANLYLREFKNGPYAGRVHGLLANFYHGLYNAIRYKDEEGCFEEYIKNHPDKLELKYVQLSGIYHYEKVISSEGKNANREWFESYITHYKNLQNGVLGGGSQWCTD